FATSFAKHQRYPRGRRLVLYDAEGDFDGNFDWWKEFLILSWYRSPRLIRENPLPRSQFVPRRRFPRGSTKNPTPRRWAPRPGSATDRGRCSHPDLVRAAPPLRPDMIFARHRCQG